MTEIEKEKLGKTQKNKLKTINDKQKGVIWKEGVSGEKIWMGSLLVNPNVKTDSYYHEESNTVHYVLEGEVTVFYGEKYMEREQVSTGDFIYIPSYTSYILKNNQESQKIHIVTTMAPKFNLKYTKQNEYTPLKKKNTIHEKIKVVRLSDLDSSTDQTKNMPRKTAIQTKNLWIGRVTGEKAMDSGKHHHGKAETVGFIISGATNLLYGENYKKYVHYAPGDFLRVPMYLPHIEQNPSKNSTVEFLTARNPENIVVNLE